LTCVARCRVTEWVSSTARSSWIDTRLA